MSTEKKEWLETILNSIRDAAIMTNGQGTVTFMNGAAQALTGRAQASAVGQELGEIFKIAEEVSHDRRQAIPNPITQPLQVGATVSLPAQTLLFAQDGRPTRIIGRAMPLKNDRGEITGTVLIFRVLPDQSEFA
jgi:PAS domain S-box-containing protein